MVTVSLCMIVKNEETVLARCLKTAGIYADEIIIIDTGSEDRTMEIARQYTKQIYEFPWSDDFAAARNESFSRASMDYCMWLDADDVVTEENAQKLRLLKETLDPSTDIVMMNYTIAEDPNGRPLFSYYRERLIRNSRRFLWEGPVHEVIAPRGNILYSDITVCHRKTGSGDPDRNLRIYEKILTQGGHLNERGRFYYARELYFHKRWQESANAFVQFLQGDGWTENQIEACLNLAECYRNLGLHQQKLTTLFHSFQLDSPRGEICCEIGRHFLESGQYKTAAFWYETALRTEPPDRKGAFVRWDCYDSLPKANLAICYKYLCKPEEAGKGTNQTCTPDI